MTDKTYPYDPDLPYVLVNCQTGKMMGRAVRKGIAESLAAGLTVDIIDTTPAPRVPEDARFIMYPGVLSPLYFAFREGVEWGDVFGEFHDTLEDLPGVTPDTVFTVLDERKQP